MPHHHNRLRPCPGSRRRQNVIKIPFLFMSLRVARGVYNPEKERFHYYVSFKPSLDPTEEERGADQRRPVDVAFSVTETGDLADLAFSLPPPCRGKRSLEYLSRTRSAAWWKKRSLSP